jgi:colanic acid/amylovoran biosynthesis glycosyltransferase
MRKREYSVVFCGRNNVRGGVETWMLDLLPSLTDAGVRVVLCAFEYDDCGSSLVERLVKHDVRVHRIPSHRSFSRRIAWLSRILDDEQADVLVPNYYLSGFFAARNRPRVKVVSVLHSDDPLYRRILHEVCRANPDFPCDAMIAVSSFLQEKALPLKERGIKTVRIPYGVPRPTCRASAVRESLRLLYAGRMVQEQKRVLDTAKCACQAVKSIPGVEMDFFGSGSDLELCRRIVRKHRVGTRIRFPGALTPDAVRRRMPEYHVFVLLSDYEGLPIALLEAMSVGLVPVCTHVRSGIAEVVKDEINGLLVSDRDQSFVAAIRRLAVEKGLWERLSKAAIETSRQYSLDSSAFLTLELLDDLVADRSVSGCLRATQTHDLREARRYPEFRHDFVPSPLWKRLARRLRQRLRDVLPRNLDA